MDHRFHKSERLTSKLIIDQLFAGGNASLSAFPLRVVYMPLSDASFPPVSILVSVPKKRFHHAVDRNRMKRLVRESYRLNKHILWNALTTRHTRLAIAFVCITDQLPSYRMVNKNMRKALVRIAEKLD